MPTKKLAVVDRTRHVRLFKNGRSQAVRIPKDLELPGDEALIYRVGANDLLVAAHARQQDATLVTDNIAEFRRVPGLRVENWRRNC